jgi:mannose-6-phosphate isomerase-like protein (cupin superfamily)
VAEAGQTVEVPQNGERFTFLATAVDTGGELLRMELLLERGGAVPSLHVHPRQEERFAVRGGTLGWHLDGQEGTANPGEVVVIPPGATHRVWNAGDDRAKTIIEFRPALTIEYWFEAFGALAAAGKLDGDGVPRLLDAAVVLRQYPGVLYAARPPVPLQRLALPLLALIGRLLGRGL